MISISKVAYFSPILADAGSPLVFARAFHLLIGNYLIGLLEVWVMCRFVPVLKEVKNLRRAVIIANYASMLVGLFLLMITAQTLAEVWFKGFTIESSLPVIQIVAGLSLPVSFVIEWPFVWRVCKGLPNRNGLSLKACALAQIASYVVLGGAYFLVSDHSLARLPHVPFEGVKDGSGYSVYYLSIPGGRLMRRKLDQTNPEVVQSLPHTDSQFLLEAVQAGTNSNWTLQVVDGMSRDKGAPVWQAPPKGEIALAGGVRAGDEHYRQRFGSHFLEPAPRYGILTDPVYAEVGLVLRAKDKKAMPLHFATAGQFLELRVMFATEIPGGFVLFEYAGRELVLLDVEKRTLSSLGLGRSPLVVRTASP